MTSALILGRKFHIISILCAKDLIIAARNAKGTMLKLMVAHLTHKAVRIKLSDKMTTAAQVSTFLF